MKEVIAQGAEAVLYRDGGVLVKDRVSKDYRLKEIDDKLRKRRTKREVKLLKKLDFVPNVLDSDDYKIRMQFIEGNLLKDTLDGFSVNDRRRILNLVGSQIAEMHDLDVIHGDLTTSNMILSNERVYFIDFGLGLVSVKVEDKAVDLFLLKKALEAKHYQHFSESYSFVIEGYKKSGNFKSVIERLRDVESRGRYKKKQQSL